MIFVAYFNWKFAKNRKLDFTKNKKFWWKTKKNLEKNFFIWKKVVI